MKMCEGVSKKALQVNSPEGLHQDSVTLIISPPKFLLRRILISPLTL